MGKNKVNNKIRLYMELAVMCCFLVFAGLVEYGKEQSQQQDQTVYGICCNLGRLYMKSAVMCCFLCICSTGRVWERRNKAKILEKHRAPLKREIKVNVTQCLIG